MNIISKSIINIKFINNDLFYELDKDEKSLFYDKYELVYDYLPLRDRLSRKTRKAINNGIMDSIINKKSSYINEFYMNYINKVMDTPTSKLCRYISFNDFFNKNDEDNLLSRLYKYVEYVYIRSNLGDIKEIDKDFFLKVILTVRVRVTYTSIANKDLREFYESVLLYIAAYFISHDELYGNSELFLDVCNFFENNLDFLYYHYTNNYNNHFEAIPIDLINRYNNGLVKRKIE